MLCPSEKMKHEAPASAEETSSWAHNGQHRLTHAYMDNYRMCSHIKHTHLQPQQHQCRYLPGGDLTPAAIHHFGQQGMLQL